MTTLFRHSTNPFFTLQGTTLTFDGRSVPVVLLDGRDPWFWAQDLCPMLHFQEETEATVHVPDRHRTTWQELGTRGSSLVGGQPEDMAHQHPRAVMISEPGFYHLLCESRHPVARAFQTWLTETLLPSLIGASSGSRPRPLFGPYINAAARLANPSELVAPAMAFHQLPTEMKLRVFSYFTQKDLSRTVARVCREWQDLAHDAAFWKTVTIDEGFLDQNKAERYRRLLVRQSAAMTGLKVTCFWVDLAHLMPTEASFPRLTRLKLWLSCTGSLTEPICRAWLDTAPHLEALSLRFKHDADIRIVRTLFSLPRLVRLAVKRTRHLNDAWLRAIADDCGQLETCIVRPYYETDETDGTITDAGCGYLCERLRGTLTHLELGSSRITNRAVEAIGTCRRLRVLSLCGHDDITCVTPLRALTQLTTLALILFPHVSAQSLVEVFRRLTALRVAKLWLVEIPANALHALSSGCPYLHTLEITNACKTFSDADAVAAVDRCVHLTHLTLCYQKVKIEADGRATCHTGRCEGISPAAFRTVLRRQGDAVVACTLVCGARSSECVIDASMPPLPRLRFLQMTMDHATFDESTYRTVADRCPSI